MADKPNTTPGDAPGVTDETRPEVQIARRRLLGGASGGALLALAGAAHAIPQAADAHRETADDGGLLRACARFGRVNNAFKQADHAYGDETPGTANYDGLQKRADRLHHIRGEAAARIAGIPAYSMLGIHARAAVLRAMYPFIEGDDGGFMVANWDHGLLQALLADLARLQGVAA